MILFEIILLSIMAVSPSKAEPSLITQPHDGLARSTKGAQVFWSSTLQEQEKIYKTQHDKRTNYDTFRTLLRSGDELRAALIVNLRTNASLGYCVRDSLRNDDRPWVRLLSIYVLIKAYGIESSNDVIFALSDPDTGVRGACLVGIEAAKIEKFFCNSLPASLLSKDPNERWGALYGIRRYMGPDGLPYYSLLLYDKDPEVASEAALAFQTCKKEDATPLLLRYLQQMGRSRSRKAVTQSVIESLNLLNGDHDWSETNETNITRQSIQKARHPK